MKVRKSLLVAAGWAGLTAQTLVHAQVPVVPAALPPGFGPAPAPLGIAPGPAQPGPVTFWQKLGLGKQQKEFCKRKLCETQLGQLLNNSKAPLSALSGGLVPPFCPTMPSIADLADPGAVGAASAIQADEAGAKKRRAAVRYLGTVDCHYWPEAEDALVASLRGDRNECVRWEAAMALGSGCCCTKKTIEALTIVVSCSDRDGAPKETSWRVHGAAAAALDHCLACFRNVAAAPAAPPTPPPPPVEGPRPPVEGVTPPPPPPVTLPVTAASAKPINPGEAKPAPGLNPLVTKDPPKRPVGPEYYARVAKASLAAVLAEARRVAEMHHNKPIISDTPFASQGHTVAALMSYATGPDTQTVVPAGMTMSTGEVRAEVVSGKPMNLWDLMNQPAGQGEVVTMRPTDAVVVAPAPKSMVVKQEPIVVKSEPMVAKTEPARKPLLPVAPPTRQVVRTPAPAAKTTPMRMPAPMPPPSTVTKSEPTLDFPPPAKPMPVGEPMTRPSGPSPYFATKGTGSAKPAEPMAPGLSSYHPMSATPAKSVPAGQQMASASGPSPYFATMGTNAVPSANPAEPMAPGVSSYHPMSATPAMAVPAGDSVASKQTASPYFATKGAGTAATPPEPTAPGVSSYHATSATPATRVPAGKSGPSNSPYNGSPAAPLKGQSLPMPTAKSVPATLPSPSAMPAVPMRTRPVPPPAAPVVPATLPGMTETPTVANEAVSHLLATAKGTGPVEVRKASIQELVKLKANTPEVLAAMDRLSDDPVPQIRAEAVIAGARLKMGR